MKKSQSEVISIVIIAIIAIGLISIAFTWGLPLIQKRQDTALVDRAFNYFNKDNANSLAKKIEFVAKNGGEQTFVLDVSGQWILSPCADRDNTGQFLSGCTSSGPENNSIQFTIFSKATNIASNVGWVKLSSGNDNPSGIVGIDDSSVIFGRADTFTDGFKVTFKTWFRQLNESNEKAQKIILMPRTGSPLISDEKTVRISRGDVKSVTLQGGQTLIATEIKILFG